MRRSLTPIAAAAMLAALAGCAGKVADPNSAAIAANGSIAQPPPPFLVPDSPHALVDAFVQAMNRRDVTHYRQLFTEDFEFVFVGDEPAGNPFPGRQLTRALELESAEHLFVDGTADLAPAGQVTLTVDPLFFVEPDSRPGKTFPWHQQVRKNFTLRVDAGDWDFYTTGWFRFFIVRGDSAAIPPELASRGFAPDTSRWWIERWEDDPYDVEATVGRPAERPNGAFSTWGALKWFYLGAPQWWRPS